MALVSLAAATALAPAAAAEPPSLTGWIADSGGSLVRDGDGEILSIDLSRSWVTDIDLRRLGGLARLERLGLAQTHVTDRALRVVASLPSLRELDLFFCEHVTDAGASTLRRAGLLEKLNVRGTKISDSGVRFLTELDRLRWLDIGIAEISDASVELLEAMPFLEHLAIGGNRVSEVGVASLRALKRLKHLDLSGAQETDSGIWAVSVNDASLGDIAALHGIESLNLAAPSRQYVEAVSSGVPRLRGSIRVTDLGASKLARLSSLRKLNLSRAVLTARGIRSLAALARLETLSLSHAESVDDTAGAALAELRALRTIDVSYTRFGDQGLAALRDHPSLERVVAVGTLVSVEEASRFASERSGRDVIR